MNASRRLVPVEINDMMFFMDPEELKGLDFGVALALSFLPLLALLAVVFAVALLEGRRTLGSWTLAFRVCTRRIAQSFATSSPP
jgi:hypothetical protein